VYQQPHSKPTGRHLRVGEAEAILDAVKVSPVERPGLAGAPEA